MIPKRLPPKKAAITILVIVFLSPLLVGHGSSLQLTTTNEYNRYVYTHLDTNSTGGGNYTTLDKPIFPVMINSSQIQIGANWTITCPLQADHNYHVYCYGKWVDTPAEAKTDYDISVYDPQGALESSHTEAAGFPEHLGTTLNDALFTPKQSGNYSFVIKNDARESQDAQAATFMIIEALECNHWYSIHLEGKGANDESRFETCKAYEFVTNNPEATVYVKVPDGLDMYEARLYRMSGAGSPSINAYPLAWEPGLYGDTNGDVGGYMFETEAYRGVSYGGCEKTGQDITLTYDSGSTEATLYHLVLIGEEGAGDVEIMFKTQFEIANLTSRTSLARVFPDVPHEISYASGNTTLEDAQLSYTTDEWSTNTTLSMVITNQTICNATIPGQKAGTFVQYQVRAQDIMRNILTVEGDYAVKSRATINITTAQETFQVGQNFTVTGTLTPYSDESTVTVQFFTSNSTKIVDCDASNGTFTATIQLDEAGTWAVSAIGAETSTAYICDCGGLLIEVKEPPLYIKYSTEILISLVVISAVGGALYYFKFRPR
jgi:hypothetical protein